MGDRAEEQLEELEVLEAILDADLEVLSREPPLRFRVQLRDEEQALEAALELEWPAAYPGVAPALAGVSGHAGEAAVREHWARAVADEDLLETAMTFELVDGVREALPELCAATLAAREAEAAPSLWETMQARSGEGEGDGGGDGEGPSAGGASAGGEEEGGVAPPPAPAPELAQDAPQRRTKDHRTKAQKRRAQMPVGPNGEMPRGYGWVNLVSHLQKIGSQGS